MGSKTALTMKNQHFTDRLLSSQLPTEKIMNNGITNIHLENNYITENEDDFMDWDDDWFIDEIEEVPIRSSLKPLDEQDLSQKLSQLSTSHQPTEHINLINDDMNENLPDYLSKGSKCFEEAMNHLSSSTTMIEDLRQMAVLIYHLFIINLEKSLWLTYMKAGTGKFNSNQVNNNNNNKIDPCIWPIEVQTTMKKSIKNNNHDNNTNCLTFATQYLSDLENKINNYETQLNIAKHRLREHLQTIELFIQQKFESFRLRIEHQIELVQYNYNDRMLELEYLQYNPTPHQKQIVNQLNHAKYQEAITKEEYNLLQQRLSVHQLSQTSLNLPEEKLFGTIENQQIRQKLCHQYQNVAQQAKKDMMQLCLSSAKAQMDRYHKQFNNKIKQYWIEQRSLPIDQKIPTLMFKLIEQRWNNMTESVQCVYKYKRQLHLLDSNSVKK